MCIGGRSQAVQPKPTFRDAPPVVTGSQTGVENPKDTKKATEQLKIKRQKKEGTYVDPNLSMLEENLTTRTGSRRLPSRQRANRDAARGRAQSMARNRLKSKYKSSRFQN